MFLFSYAKTFNEKIIHFEIIAVSRLIWVAIFCIHRPLLYGLLLDCLGMCTGNSSTIADIMRGVI